MDPHALVVPREESVETLLSQPESESTFRHIVVGQDGRIVGVLRINTALRHASAAAQSDIRVGEVASRDFIIVGVAENAFVVIQRMWRHHATMAVVVRGTATPEISGVVGVISKEHIADAVAASVAVYPG